MKITKNDKVLLVEAYRRYKSYHNDNDIKSCWLGLGTKSDYKSKFFKLAKLSDDKYISHWWVLTDKGIEIMKKIIENNDWDKSMKLKLFDYTPCECEQFINKCLKL